MAIALTTSFSSIPWPIFVATVLIFMGCIVVLATLLWSQRQGALAAKGDLQTRPYSQLLPLLAADVLSPTIRRLYVKSLFVDATVEERSPTPDILDESAKATRECRRLLAELQARAATGKDFSELHRRIDALLDEALLDQALPMAEGSDRPWQKIYRELCEIRRGLRGR